MPTTHGNLFDAIASIPNLLNAAHKAALNKRHKPCVDAFRMDLEREVWFLHEQLMSASYRPGPYRAFWIHDPKKRLISAAPFRDRVIHHAICTVVEPLWERRFVSESYANRFGRGTSAARDHFDRGMRAFPVVVRCDIRKFFPSMDHEVLKRQFRRTVRCRRTLALLDLVVDASNPQEPVAWHFPGDDLWTPHLRRHGLPLGNQTSQFFANVYLDPLDLVVKERLRCPHYVRYVDDLALFAPDHATARRWLAAVEDEAGLLRLRLHEGKSRAYNTRDGVTFLGVRFWPGRRRLATENVRRARRRLRRMIKAVRAGTLRREEAVLRWAGWRGHAREGRAEALAGRLVQQARIWMAEGGNARPCGAGRWLEQSSPERPFGEPQQEPTRQQEHQ